MSTAARRTLLLLAGIFLTPLLLAWVVYQWPAWQPEGGLQHGELMPPSSGMRLTAGYAPGVNLLTGHWTLLYRAAGPCNSECRGLLDTLNRVRLSQGKAMHRVQLVLLLPESTAAGSVLAQQPDLSVVMDRNWILPAASVYLFDPQGRPVLRYHPGFEPMDLVKDLRRLLRLAGEG